MRPVVGLDRADVLPVAVDTTRPWMEAPVEGGREDLLGEVDRACSGGMRSRICGSST